MLPASIDAASRRQDAAVALYVYWRTRADDTAAAAALARLAALLRAGGWPAPAAWRRPDRRDGLATWMETHPAQPVARIDALLDALEAACAGAGLAALIEGPRHVERFVAVPLEAPAAPAAPADLKPPDAS